MVEEFNMNFIICVMNGGEDYEFFFIVFIVDYEKVLEMEGVCLIGYIIKFELGCVLIICDGQEFELKVQGWNLLQENK